MGRDVCQEKGHRQNGATPCIVRISTFTPPPPASGGLSGASLQAALAEGRIRAAYQPIITLAEGGVVAEEALARWVLRDGTVSPAQAFIETADACGLLPAVDETVLSQTLARCHRRQALGEPARLHFVNISTALLMAPDRLARVADLVAPCGMSWTGGDSRVRALVVEITERELIPHLPSLVRALHPLLAAGVRLALDDFGSGYSSFLYLAELPITFLKIEQALIARVGRDSRVDMMVAAIARMATDLNVITIAEGIESAETAAAVAALGVTWGQGYYFGRPGWE